METGILQILSNATNGLSIILEHRYYGESHVTADLSTDNLRWLNNKESLEDSAEFIRSFPVPDDVKRKLKDKKIFDPSKTPYIYYGGSYAGARAAFMRTEYPDLVYGAIGSSGVTHAQVYYPEYFDPIITYGEPGCIKAMEESIAAVDELLDKGSETNAAVKQLFGLEALTDLDFAGVLQYPTGGWQGQNWDPAVGSDEWDKWCRALTTARAANDSTPPSVAGMSVPASLFNYADYIKTSVIRPACPSGDIVSCFGESTPEEYQNTSLAQTWRLWQFQVCTQWGYYQVAPKSPKRTIVSRKITLESQAKVCKLAYPPGEKFQVPVWPDVHETNSRGSYYIAADRLAFIDGEIDPWRPVTPNADVAPKRNSTTLRPIWIIPRGVHHYDENGLADHSQEPEEIRAVHKFEIEFVQAWLKDFGKGNGGGGGHGHGHGQGQGHGHGDGHGDGHGHADGHGHGHGNGHGHGHHGHDDDQDDNQDGNDQGENEDGDGGGDDQQ